MKRLVPLALAALALAAGSASAADAATTSVTFGGYWTGAKNERPVGTAKVTTPSSWPRTSADGAHSATFSPIAVSTGCTAVAHVNTRTFAASWMAAALVSENVPDSDVVRSGGTADSPWRVGAAPAAFESPMRVYGLREQEIARNRYAGISADVLFSDGCPASAIHDAAVVDAVEQILSTAVIDVERKSTGQYKHVTGPLGVELLKPPASIAGCPDRIDIGARNTRASRARGVYAVRAFRVRPDGSGKFRINRVLFNEERNASLRGFRKGTLRGTCDDFAVLYQIHVHRPGQARRVVKQLYRVSVTP